MEQWKMSILTGAALLILAITFAMLRGGPSIWTVLIVILAVVDIALGVYRKKVNK